MKDYDDQGSTHKYVVMRLCIDGVRYKCQVDMPIKEAGSIDWLVEAIIEAQRAAAYLHNEYNDYNAE